jgi:hypothetical protein
MNSKLISQARSRGPHNIIDIFQAHGTHPHDWIMWWPSRTLKVVMCKKSKGSTRVHQTSSGRQIPRYLWQEKFKVDQSLRWVHTHKSRSLYLLILVFVDLPYRLWNVGPTLEVDTCEGWDTIGWLYPYLFDHPLILIQPWLRYVVEEYRDRVSFLKLLQTTWVFEGMGNGWIFNPNNWGALNSSVCFLCFFSSYRLRLDVTSLYHLSWALVKI